MSIRRILFLTTFPLLLAAPICAQEASPGAAPVPPSSADAPRTDEDFAARHEAFCGERYAHEAGRLSYLEARLDLTDKQRSAWSKWRQVQLDNANREQTDCLSMTPDPKVKPTALEIEARLEKELSTRLQNLQSSRPVLDALYEVLTPVQRAVFDRPPHGDHFAPPHGDPFGQPGPMPPKP